VVVRKLETTDGFYALDLEDATVSVGVVRLAPKVLVDGAELLARAATYAFAAFGVNAGGVSAGINAKPEGRDAAVTAFCEAVAPLVAEGRIHLSPGTGLTAEELAPLGCEPLDPSLAARGAVVAAAAFGGAGDGVVVGDSTWQERVGPWWSDAGGTGVDEGGLDADVPVLFLAGRSGFVDHEAASTVRAKLVVPLTPVPVTAKAYAVLSRAGVVFVPDAVSCAAPLLAVADPDGEDPVSRVAALASEIASRGVDAWRAMVDRAEEHLTSWRPALPFGRPLA
jgi:glutamate dehydrogenase/leucine dehydrogenase